MTDGEKSLLLNAYYEYKENSSNLDIYPSRDLIIVSIENEKSLYELLLDPVEGKKVLINNKYGLFGSLLYKYIDKLDLELFKKFILSDVDVGGKWGVFRKSNLKFLPYEIRNDRNFIVSLLPYNPNALFLASDELKENKDFVLSCIRDYHCGFEYAGKGLRNSRDFVLQCLREFRCNLKYVSEDLKCEEEIIFTAITYNPSSYNYISKELKENKEFVEKLLELNLQVARYAIDVIKNDRKLVIQSLKVDPCLYELLDLNFRNDKEIFKCVIDAGHRDSDVIKYAGEDILNDKELMLEYASKYKMNWDVMKYFKQFDTWDEDMLKACFEKPYCIYSYGLYNRFLKNRKSLIKDYFSCVAKIINYKFDVILVESEEETKIVDEYLDYIVMFAKKKITIEVTPLIYEDIYKKYGTKYNKYIKCDEIEIYDEELPF